jgi:hypothetical protein
VPERSPVLWACIPNLTHIAFCYEHPEVKTAPRILNVRKKKENKEQQIKKKKINYLNLPEIRAILVIFNERVL